MYLKEQSWFKTKVFKDSHSTNLFNLDALIVFVIYLSNSSILQWKELFDSLWESFL